MYSQYMEGKDIGSFKQQVVLVRKVSVDVFSARLWFPFISWATHLCQKKQHLVGFDFFLGPSTGRV